MNLVERQVAVLAVLNNWMATPEVGKAVFPDAGRGALAMVVPTLHSLLLHKLVERSATESPIIWRRTKTGDERLTRRQFT